MQKSDESRRTGSQFVLDKDFIAKVDVAVRFLNAPFVDAAGKANMFLPGL